MIPRFARPFVLVAPLAALLSACASAPETRTQLASYEPKGEPLSAEELRTMVTGNTTSGRMNNGVPYAVYYAPNGMQKVRTGQGFRDVGEWRVTDGGQLCGKWRNIGKSGEETCLKGFRDGEAVRFTGGSATTPVHIHPGNAANL